MKKISTSIFILVLGIAAHAQTVSTLAGQYHVQGSQNGNGTAATFNGPHGTACDVNGNIFIADRDNNKIRKITPAGVVTTLAGSGAAGSTDGTGTSASFFNPMGVACDNAGNVYVADTKNYKIRKITPAGVVTTIAGTGNSGTTNGPVASAEFGYPTGIAFAPDGTIYVTEYNNHTIRKISSGTVSTLAGAANLFGDVDGMGTTARFYNPNSVVINKQGNLLVTDLGNNKIRMVTPAGNVTTYAGTGVAGFTNSSLTASQFNMPFGITVDSTGAVFVCDLTNSLIRKLNSSGVTTFAGTLGVFGHTDGPALTASFDGISCIAYNFYTNSLYVGDEGNSLIRKITISNTTTQQLFLSTNGTNNTFCTGSSVVITAQPSGLVNYVFKDGTTTIGTSATGILTLTTLSLGTHNITCTAQGTGGIQYATVNPIVITVTSNPQPATITPPGPVTVCQGSSVSLTASLGSSYLWSNSQTTRTIQVSTSGSYSVTVYNSGGCTQHSAPTVVTSVSSPTVTISPANPVPKCAGDSVLLTASASASYHWSNGAISQTIYAKQTGNYVVTVTNASGCSATSTPVSVTIVAEPTINIIPSTALVYLVSGQPLSLSVNTGSVYQWSTNASTQSITITSAGLYWARLQNANGCWSKRDTALVQSLNISSVMAAQGSTTICPSDSVILRSFFTIGNQWYKNNVAIAGATSQNYNAKQTGYYKVKINQGGGNFVTSDSVNIIVKNVPTSVAATNDSVCAGREANISVVQQTGVTYTWFSAPTSGTALANGTTYQTNPLNSPTTFYLQVAANGCINPQRFPVEAYVYAEIKPSFTTSSPAKTTGGFEVQFTNQTDATNINFLWDFGDVKSQDNTSTLSNPSHIYPEQGAYEVELIATNRIGCVDTLIQTVVVEMQHDLFLPSAFTPNNDGTNDIFRLRGTQILSSTMQIYNQWGQQIFYTDNAQTGWDGTVNGKTAQNGTYKYIVKVEKQGEISKTLTGNISLIK
jgi:gliding motility-associated-like protein